MTIHELLRFTAEAGASDLHVAAGSHPMVRVNGKMKRLNLPVLSPEDVENLVYGVMNEVQQELFRKNLEIDFSTKLSTDVRFRVNAYHQINGISAAFRVIPNEIMSYEELRLPEVLKRLTRKEKGLILVTGPTGSGKSTTLATMIDSINDNRFCHIITVEDPIEFVHRSKNSLINQRELGHDTWSFTAALRSALRQDPDVILVGEMRDLETVSLALTAAETGHLVFATLHTGSCTKSIDRVIDMFPKEQQQQVRSMLSESLEAVISQTLLPTKDGKGRVPAVEIMLANAAVRNLIREEKTYQIPSIIQSSTKEGMQTKDQSLYNLVMNNYVERTVAEEVAENPKLFASGAGF
ncbi:MAG: type IV pilus twitching motility protein PilT [Candidatus Cloacimonetes bacterium]|nr:type IV pilus twitching motility protein PilT [Candidatus Cloacimonadota bacterium]MDD2422710.1 type IV pilus twitching motility protein PilT [Candidatus Cloacimonadota bacterium]MDD3563785.1 type IV pilus twitching motility protein PilT [Candidatus Cloacimonadota bacterium]MDD4276281.1 type IV pilus twitching motility protein PilT [Candidatus Cloacimonadota bacterium]MDY0325505.1 type IV pilus twitching motility protein PilT [Candidatus Cloacimonadaceae bacterium]